MENRNSVMHMIPDELIITILCFLDHKTVLCFGICCKRFYMLSETPIVWKSMNRYWIKNFWLNKKESMLSEHHKMKETVPLEVLLENIDRKLALELKRFDDILLNLTIHDNYWKNEMIKMCSLKFDSGMKVNQRKCVYSNYDRTAFNSHSLNSNWWETIRVKKELLPGNVYYWYIYIDKLIQCPENLWWIMIGVEVPDFNWSNQDHWVDVIGYSNYKGSCLICGPMKKRYIGQEISIKRETDDTITTGDTIYVKFDMTNSSEENDIILERLKSLANGDLNKYLSDVESYQKNNNRILGASLEFWRNGKYIEGSKIVGISRQLFYPTVSIVHRQQVTIGYWNGRFDA